MREKLLSHTLRWCTSLLVAVAVTASVLPAQTSTREKHEQRRERPQSRFTLFADPTFEVNVNNWLCGLDSEGSVCVNTFGSTTGGGGLWPLGTTNQYVFLAGLQMAARDPLDPANSFVAVHCMNVSATNAACRALSDIFHSDDAADLAAWPETCNLVNPQTGEVVKTLSQLDTCVRYWDGDPAATVPGGHPMGVEVVQHTLAFTLSGFRDMIFFIFKVKNISNTALFKAANPAVPDTGWTLEEMFVAFGHDADVSGNEFDENFGTFVPFLNDTTPLWIASIWQSDFEAGDFEPYAQCGFCNVPGFVGTTFLRSPYNNTGQPVTNLASGRVIPSIDQDRLEMLRLQALGLGLNLPEDTAIQREAQDTLEVYEIGQSFGSLTTRGGTFPDPEDPATSWRYYSGNLNAAEQAQTVGSPPGFGFVDQPSPADTRYFHATGPFRLAPGDSVEVIVGLVGGAPVLNTPGFTPGNIVAHGIPTDTARIIEKIMGRGNLSGPAYPSLFKQVLDARSLFETNFLLPSPPPAPTVTAIAGDGQIALTWSDDPVNASDPYKPVADARGIPNFREQDFEGFRVYRKVRPAAEFELIAQFDLANGLTEVITTTDSVQVVDSSYLAVRQDTAHAGTDTGLQFAIVDRGGRFPDPSNGPGLTNGLTYFYTVTSYDINTPFAPGGSSLESGQRLTRTTQGVGGAAAVPRSTAGGRQPFQVSEMRTIGGGTVLDPTASVSIDPATGTFSGPQPPTNAVALDIIPVDEVELPVGDVSLTIDSVVALNGFEDVLGVHQMLAAPNGLGVTVAYFGTLESADGIQPFRAEATSPFGLFASPTTIDTDFVNANLRAATGTHFAAVFSGDVSYGPTYLSSGTEAVSALRSHVVGSEGGSRWFVGQEPAEPTLGNAAGQLPGVTQIYNLADQYAKQETTPPDLNPAVRWLVYLNEALMRGADYEVTWGANGEIDQVMDLTHNVPVPFSDHYGATWGIRNEASGDGFLSIGDFWFATPVAEWFCEATGCHVPLDSVAVIQPMSTDPPPGFGTDVAAANTQGFGLFIGGEVFLFETTQLPAAGTTWILRTHAGDVVKDATSGTYSFTPVARRPPPVPGLTFQLTIEEATTFDLAEATLTQVHTVPDPYFASSPLQTGPADRRIQFVNLPAQATIRIFSLSGVLVNAISHNDAAGGGTAEWDLRNRSNQYVASGVYFYHIETPDGKEKIGKFTIIQAP